MYSWQMFAGFQVMFCLIVLSALFSVARLVGIWNHDRFLVLWGLILLIVGGYALVFLPEFFHTMKELPYSYWHRVSLYSMPAICIEGGLFSLFRAYLVYAAARRSTREHGLLFGVFLLYAIIAVAVNFLAINNTISVDNQLLFSRVVLTVSLMMTAVVYRFRNTVSPTVL